VWNLSKFCWVRINPRKSPTFEDVARLMYLPEGPRAVVLGKENSGRVEKVADY
jgi:hypothetical protein